MDDRGRGTSSTAIEIVAAMGLGSSPALDSGGSHRLQTSKQYAEWRLRIVKIGGASVIGVYVALMV